MRVSALGALVFATSATVCGCGVTVLIPGETGGTGGVGGQATVVGGTGGVGGVPSTGTGLFDNCESDCVSNGVDACSCAFQCSGFPGNAKAECAPSVDLQGNLKTKCVCTVSDGFTGVCFEKNPAHLCDFDQGCCGKYAGK